MLMSLQGVSSFETWKAKVCDFWEDWFSAWFMRLLVAQVHELLLSCVCCGFVKVWLGFILLTCQASRIFSGNSF